MGVFSGWSFGHPILALYASMMPAEMSVGGTASEPSLVTIIASVKTHQIASRIKHHFFSEKNRPNASVFSLAALFQLV